MLMQRLSTNINWTNFTDKNVASGVVQCDLSDHYALFANFRSNSVSKKGKKRFPDVAILVMLMLVLELSLVLLIGTLCAIRIMQTVATMNLCTN